MAKEKKPVHKVQMTDGKRQIIQQLLQEYDIATAEKNNAPLYCGEYGVIDLASNEDTIEWYKTINEIFKKYDIGRAAWSYNRMNFGLSDAKYDDIREELLKYL